MRILCLGINYWPDETGIAPFNTKRCEYLAARGHQVTMCTGFPYYPEWRLRAEYRGRIFQREARNGVTIRRSYLFVPRSTRSAGRVLLQASFVASSCAAALAGGRPDLMYVVSPPLPLGLSAIFLSRLWRIPYVFHVEDLHPDAALELGMLPSGRLMKLLYQLERISYQHAAVVSAITEAMRERIVMKGIPRQKAVVFSHWSDPRLFDVPISGGGGEFRREHGLDGRFVVLHSGNMGVKQGLEVILEAAALCTNRPDIVFLMAGDGAIRKGLEERAQTLKLPNLRFLPVQDRARFFDMLGAADLTLVTQHPAATDIGFPSKMESLLAAGRPIAAALLDNSEVARVLADAGAGVSVPAGNASELAAAIRLLQSDSERRYRMGESGRQYARKRWDPDRILPDTESALVALASGEPPVAEQARYPDSQG